MSTFVDFILISLTFVGPPVGGYLGLAGKIGRVRG